MSGISSLKYFRRKWQFLLLMESVIAGTGPSVLAFALGLNIFWIGLIFLISTTVYFIFQKPWDINYSKITGYIDLSISEVEHSSGLLLVSDKNLTPVARLQKYKTERILPDKVKRIKPQINLERALAFLVVFSIIAVLSFISDGTSWNNSKQLDEKSRIIFTPVDSLDQKNKAPEILAQRISIDYPAYTKLRTRSSEEMNIKTLKNSLVKWVLKFDQPVEDVFLDIGNERFLFASKKNKYSYAKTISESGFYNFRFKDTLGNSYVSKVYYLQVEEDQKPEVVIKNLPLFSVFNAEEEKILNFETQITDDYGIDNAYIIATVSKGSGEAVKFREERIEFDKKISGNPKSVSIQQSINLDDLNMIPGEQLYFYVEAKDRLAPTANIARSETYFTEIRDTTEAVMAVSGGMGVDLMPDYFRSQRQLIIDTEKLIAEKDEISEKEFNSQSNELGFDQKALRLKYGKFMGDEAESGIAAESHAEEPEATTEENDEDPLEDYTHDHDSENERNLVVEENEDEPLHDYLHNHDDPEESTLFTQSLKSMLREAMNQMWDSELHLRLYEPQNSLPYQYRSLKLLQEIKNSARIYVHRIGFDPPPIKENTRLSGDLDEVQSFSENKNRTDKNQLKNIRESVLRLENIIQKDLKITVSDRVIFKSAADELSSKVIEDPLKFLETLSDLKLLSEGRILNNGRLRQIQKGLLLAIPKNDSRFGTEKVYRDELQQLFLKELNNVE